MPLFLRLGEKVLASQSDFTIRGADVQMSVRAAVGERPMVLYWGTALADVPHEQVVLLSTTQPVPGGPAKVIQPTLSNELGVGYGGASGFRVHSQGRSWAVDFRVVSVAQKGPDSLTIQCKDYHLAIKIFYQLQVCESSGLIRARAVVVNDGPEELTLDQCAPICMPLDSDFTRLRSFSGRWAGEFQTGDFDFRLGSYVRENRAGRTSHDNFPGIIAMEAGTTEEHGRCAGLHLAWSGNSRILMERHSNGRCQAQLGEHLFPGEIILKEGERYTSPALLVSWSDTGLGEMSRRFHDHLQATVLDARTGGRPRPVHFNTWEAVYFDHDEDKLNALAEQAAALGAERFVLDDGWFGARRHDAAGLGDWTVSPDVFPNGLRPLADHVRCLGMDFGLWFEPEMVNPDSELFRRHPDWVLKADGPEPISSRNQLPLDLSRREVVDHLFAALSERIDELGIAYIKWDMNRDVHHPGSVSGSASTHGQTEALYGLMERLRSVHPSLEIESCASGGGRADFGVLRYTDRVWTSDNNDALERAMIHRGASHFFPPRVLGNHVGARTCHITGRSLGMDIRVTSAFLGQMGLELDPDAETSEDLEKLKRGIDLYKEHRELIHNGHYRRLELPVPYTASCVVSRDGREALVTLIKLDQDPYTAAPKLKLRGLGAKTSYRIRQVWPETNVAISSPSIVEAAKLLTEGAVLRGDALASVGLPLPVMMPQTGMILHLSAR